MTDEQGVLAAAAHRAVSTRLPGSAEVSECFANTGHTDVHVVTVTPRVPGAAQVCVGASSDEVTVTAGGTPALLHATVALARLRPGRGRRFAPCD